MVVRTDKKKVMADLSNLVVIMFLSVIFLFAFPYFFVFRANYAVFTVGFFIPLFISLLEHLILSATKKKINISNSVVLSQIIWIIIILASFINYIQIVRAY